MKTLSFLQDRIIAIVRGADPAKLNALADALVAGGIRRMEITFAQGEPASWAGTAEAIRALAGRGDLQVGAGTVVTVAQLAMAAEAGAEYILSPHTDPELIRETKRLGLFCIPGAMTPTEIVSAFAAGADAVKLFPAGTLGLAYFRAIAAPLGHIPMLAVGGMDESNCADFLRAGAVGIGVGGKLAQREWLQSGAWDRVTEQAKKLVAATRE